MIMTVSSRFILSLALCTILSGCGGRKNAIPPQTEKAAAPLPVETVKPDTRPVIVAFGDSLSAGYGLDAGKSFPDNVQRLIDSSKFNWQIVNMGVSGDTTTDGLVRISSVLAVHPKIVIVEFGGNDGLRGMPVSSTENNLKDMVEAIQKAGAIVVIAGMSLPRNYGPEYIKSFEQVYVRVATKYKAVLIPFLLEGVGGNPALMQADQIHPTAEGAEIVSRTVMQHLKPLL